MGTTAARRGSKTPHLGFGDAEISRLSGSRRNSIAAKISSFIPFTVSSTFQMGCSRLSNRVPVKKSVIAYDESTICLPCQCKFSTSNTARLAQRDPFGKIRQGHCSEFKGFVQTGRRGLLTKDRCGHKP